MRLSPWITGLAGVLAAGQTLTQGLAWQAGYAGALGAPLTTWDAFYARHGIYAPWQGTGWLWRWGFSAPEVVLWPVVAATVILLLGLLAGGKGAHGPRNRQEPPVLAGHGTARWATKADIKRMGLW